jgi:hypothetical protein
VIEIEGTTFGNNIPISSCTIVASDSENGSNILAFKIQMQVGIIN